jgi:fibro-slime domain-containing protein
MTALRMPTVARGALFLACTGVVAVLSQSALVEGGNGNGDDRESIQLTGIVRDFLPSHPDFDVTPPDGYGQYMWNVATELGEGGRPVYEGGGYKVLSQAHDAAGRPICWTICDPDAGDTPAEPDAPDTGTITSAETFGEWFQDIPGISMSMLLTVTAVMAEDGEYAGMYEVNIPQFYPVDDMLFGNDSDEHNNFFTFMIVGEFVHDTAKGYVLMFKSDDDAFVFLEGPNFPNTLMIADLGGINGSAEQWVDLNRLGLVDGEKYRVHFFKSDRNDASSRLHLVTNVPFTSRVTPTILAAFD